METLTTTQQAVSFLSQHGPAVSGHGGHNHTFAAAHHLKRLGLSQGQTLDLLSDWNSTCLPPWSPKELYHKVQDVYHKTGATFSHMNTGTQGSNPSVPTPPPEIIAKALAFSLGVPIPHGWEELLTAAFSPSESVRIVQASGPDREHEQPKDIGITLTRDSWIEQLSLAGGPDGFFHSTSSSGPGAYIQINPTTDSGGASDLDVTAFRHVLIEADNIPIAAQWDLLVASGLPITAVINSGGRSLHAWVRIDAGTREQYDARVAEILHDCPWADHKNKNPARLSRLPDKSRFGQFQSLVATGLGHPSWRDYSLAKRSLHIEPALSLDQASALGADPSVCLLGFDLDTPTFYLSKGKAAWLVGPSGIGKSSLITQMAAHWAVGRPAFGVNPAIPLKILFIQSENEYHDIRDMALGLKKGMGIISGSNEDFLLQNNLLIVSDPISTGETFLSKLATHIDLHSPHIVVVDPLLSFMGIDSCKQEEVTHFLRQGLQPILTASGVALIGVHHQGKPKPKDEQPELSSQLSYLGIGSSELTNWPRAILTLRQARENAFNLFFAKRGKRARARDHQGQLTTSVWIEHATDGSIYWNQIPQPERARKSHSHKPDHDLGGESPPKPPKPLKRDLIVSLPGMRDLLAAIPPEGISANALGDRIRELALANDIECGDTTARKIVPPILQRRGLLARTENWGWMVVKLPEPKPEKPSEKEDKRAKENGGGRWCSQNGHDLI